MECAAVGAGGMSVALFEGAGCGFARAGRCEYPVLFETLPWTNVDALTSVSAVEKMPTCELQSLTLSLRCVSSP